MKHIIATILLIAATFSTALAQTVETILTAPANFEDISVAPDGTLFLASAPGGHLVWKVTLEGELSVYAQNIYGALGGTVSPDGTVYMSLWNWGQVRAIAQDGSHVPVVTGVSGPTGIAMSNDPRYIYYAAYNTGAIYRFDTESIERELLENGPEIYGPDGLVVDDDETLYMANFLDSRIHKRTADGEMSLLATLPGNGTGYIDYHDGVLYVAGLNTHKIYQIDTSDGSWSVLAGTGVPGSTDGPALEAQFTAPNGLALSPDGRYLYIGESGRLRRITLSSTTAVGEVVIQPAQLHGASPNPFNPRTTISFSLAESGAVDVSVHDLRGRRVADLFSGSLPAGNHPVSWNGLDRAGRAVASGVYVVRLNAAGSVQSKTMTLAR